MILRALASLLVLALLGLNFMLPRAAVSARGSENLVRSDVESRLAVGQKLPELELVTFDGRLVTRDDLLGHRLLITFERSVDW